MPMVLFFAAIGLITLTSALNRSSQSSAMNERKNQLSRTVNAAEAATEKLLGEMLFDFKADGERRVYNRLNSYAITVPSAAESSLWSDFQFMDVQGRTGRIHVARTQTEQYVDLNSKYKGLKGVASNYRIISNVRETRGMYAITNAVMQEVLLASIPVFQFAIFYNSLLEFTWAAPLTIRGRVHANSNIYAGSSAPLTLTEDITSTGTIKKRSWAGYNLSQMTGNINYQGQRDTNVNSMTLPIGTNNTATAVREILQRPPASEALNSPMGQQRFYNKAELAIVVSDSGVNVKVKTKFDALPTTIPITNASYFIDTGKALRDDREANVVRLTEIDVGKLNTWAATNSDVINKLGANTPPNILFVEDTRTTASSEMTAVRLVNGRTLPNRGLTFATPNPLYVKGHYNQPNNSYQGTTNTSNVKPASLISDAITILSPNWSDGTMSGGSGAAFAGGSGTGSGYVGSAPKGGKSKGGSGRSGGGGIGGGFEGGPGGGSSGGGVSFGGTPNTPSLGSRNATDKTVNATILTGIVYAGGPTGENPPSGGVVNLTRLLEDWSNGSDRLTLNGSIVNLFDSTQATARFAGPDTTVKLPPATSILTRISGT